MNARGKLWLWPAPALALFLAPLACGDGQSPASGLTAFLRATNAQYVPGELSAEPGATAPTVELIRTNNNQVFPGAQGRAISGTVSPDSSAVLIGLAGDSAHWLVPTGVKEAEFPFNLTFATALSFSPAVPPGQTNLVFRAVDAGGAVGPAKTQKLLVDPPPAAFGALDVVLEWDSNADLDLHVRMPDPNPKAKQPFFDVWARAPLALPPKADGSTFTDAEVKAAGKLSFDSNASCVTDGLYQEVLSFPGALPAGPWELRVDTSSLCGEPTARWHLFVRDGAGTVLLETFGQSLERDTVARHDGGSGTLAMIFNP